MSIQGNSVGGLIPTAEQVGAATPADVRKAAPVNLLDNSDFRNPVNQRGKTSYTDNTYTIDRWRKYDGGTVSISEDGITISQSQYIRQKLLYLRDGTYTMSVKNSDGTVYVRNIKIENGSINAYGGSGQVYVVKDGSYFAVGINAGTWIWAALYEGEYTAETLPEYHPKGYAHELAECQRYYYKLNRECIGNGYATSTGNSAIMHLPFTMRIPNPTIVYTDFVCRANGTDYVCDTVYSANADNMLYLACTSQGIPVKYAASFFSNHPIALSADL